MNQEQVKVKLALMGSYIGNWDVTSELEWNKSMHGCNCGCHKDTLFTITHKGHPPMDVRLEDLPIELHGQKDVNVLSHYPLWLIEQLIKNYTNYSI